MNPAPIINDRRPWGEMLTKRESVVESAEKEHPGQIRPGDVQGSGHPAGGDQKLVVRQTGAVGQLDHMRAWIDRGRSNAEPELDVLARVPRGWAEPVFSGDFSARSTSLDSGGRE